ncbi:MAG: hypothetical protein BWX86_02960 [Verrucomicrobia bacterium ADurb.Bin122]|nr:MAG: hypothetical protein BWX86_02960 [Verrucomicrobia bacterium ADurb.Bin122]
MGGDDELPALIDRMDDPRDQVGERFADAGAGLKEQRGVVEEGVGDGAGHLGLLGAVFQ